MIELFNCFKALRKVLEEVILLKRFAFFLAHLKKILINFYRNKYLLNNRKIEYMPP
jgi:hypothetical protein